MKQYLITGYDYTDADALQRRLNVRPHHLVGAKAMKENGNFIIGGAMLSDEGKMIGSTMILQFETEEELEAWKQNEPYITQKVWESVDVKSFKVADV
ncbi:YciI family protein [Mucilaginibacter aquaedulcis]|uniref:YciI family protein n=1 Tax=Mucilaginibacter aquaedulcis TaxID=1187081 RepID=UPI0025B5535E|nr:YciI family protein [Mucilaginibacter aquaedulcis]MDN3547108.1 YciI family protein [Mucilaginibacter aquaedulcis]